MHGLSQQMPPVASLLQFDELGTQGNGDILTDKDTLRSAKTFSFSQTKGSRNIKEL
jgi:hypothetical protein